jgi:hypothetical protein
MDNNATLTRFETSDEGTKGILQAGGFTSRTLELPWRDNRKGRSCIPPGRYLCQLRHSRLGIVYGLSGVPGRAGILIHAGSLAGDVDKGHKSHVEGCILLGKYFGKISGQQAILVSKPTVREFQEYMNGQCFWLEVIDGTA